MPIKNKTKFALSAALLLLATSPMQPATMAQNKPATNSRLHPDIQQLLGQKPEHIELETVFINKKGQKAFDIGPGVVAGQGFKDNLLVVNASEGRGINCGGGNTQYWSSTGALALPGSFEDGKSSSEGLCAVENGMRWGFADHTGKIVIPCTYLDAKPFSEGCAAVLADKWGFIDKSGKTIAEPSYEECLPFKDGLAAVLVKDKVGFIDKSGSMVIPPTFPKARSFSCGLARVFEGPNGTDTNFIDIKGKKPIELEALRKKYGAVNFGEVFRLWDAASCIGKQIISFMSFGKEASLEGDFREGLLPVILARKFGYIDTQGNVAIEPTFSSAAAFSEGLAAASTGKLFGYINKSGVFQIEPKYAKAEHFSDGLAAVSTDGNHWGYINSKGEAVTSEIFLEAKPFNSGIACVGIAPGTHLEAATTTVRSTTINEPPPPQSPEEANLAGQIKACWQCETKLDKIDEQFTFALTKDNYPYDVHLTRGFVEPEAIKSALGAILGAAPLKFKKASTGDDTITITCTISGTSANPIVKIHQSTKEPSTQTLDEALIAVPFADKKFDGQPIMRGWMAARLGALGACLADYPDSDKTLEQLAVSFGQLGLDTNKARDWLSFGRATTKPLTIARNSSLRAAQANKVALAAISKSWRMSHDPMIFEELKKAYYVQAAEDILLESEADPLMLGTASVLDDQYSLAIDQYKLAKKRGNQLAEGLLQRLAGDCTKGYKASTLKVAQELVPLGNKADLDKVLRWLPADTETIYGAAGIQPKADEIKDMRNYSMTSAMRSWAICIPATHDESTDKQLASAEIATAVTGARAFKTPHGLGAGSYQGASIIVFMRKDFDIAKQAMDKYNEHAMVRCNIDGVEVLINQSAGAFCQSPSLTYTFSPLTGTIVRATSETYVREILNRMRTAPKDQAFAPDSAEIKSLDKTAAFWAARHNDKSYMPFDYSSKEPVRSILKVSPEDQGSTIDKDLTGSTYKMSNDGVFTIRIFSNSRRTLEKKADYWKKLLTPDENSQMYAAAGLKHAGEIQPVSTSYGEGYVVIEQKLTNRPSILMLVLMAALGLPVFI
jgi:WG containing repeat